MDAPRTCRRPSCHRPATASLSYRYATRQVWLLDLSRTVDPSLYDLCPDHADTLTVPRGWDRVDQRTEPSVVPHVVAPHEHTAVAAGPSPVRSSAPHGDRYEALRRQLPRLAAELATEATSAPVGVRQTTPVPSRELAPQWGARRDSRASLPSAVNP